MLRGLFFTLLCTGFSLSGKTQEKRYSFTESKMGSPFTIIMYAEDSMQATELARQSFSLVDSFNNIFSDYLRDSELMLLNNAAGSATHKLSPALMEILVLSKNGFDKSSGAFDITIGPLVKLWRKARKENRFPDKGKIDSVKKITGFNKLHIDTVNKTATLSSPGMSIDLGGIAKGWIAQKIIDFLSSRKITSALADAGGDIVMSAAAPGTNGWSIGINVPENKEEILQKQLLLQNKSVATSGDVYQFMEKDGKKYSHITDPRTGYGVSYQRNVTVIANDGATADWLATACSILPLKKAKKLARKMSAELLIANIKKGKIIFYATKGFADHWK